MELDEKYLDWMILRIIKLEKFRREAESVLQFYANEESYNPRSGLNIFKDNGEKARKFLDKMY